MPVSSNTVATQMELDPDMGSSRDGRGIAYAQLGRTDEAIVEFEAYLAWLRTRPAPYFERYNGPLIESWIEALKQGEQPFTQEVLDSLR